MGKSSCEFCGGSGKRIVRKNRVTLGMEGAFYSYDYEDCDGCSEMLTPIVVSDYRATLAAVREETAQRDEVMHSPEYLALEAEKKKIEAAQEIMLAHIPDSREENELDKAALIKWMTENHVYEADEFQAKTRAKRRVDTYQVLQAMDGDLDNLMLVASVTQTALEKFIRENPSYKRDLRKCIIDEGETVVDIISSAQS